MKLRYLIPFAVLLAVPAGAGCIQSPALITALQFEAGQLTLDQQDVGAEYAAKREVVQAQVDALYAAMYVDIAKRQPLDPAWVASTIKGVRAAEKILTNQLGTYASDEVQEKDNLAARKEAMTKAIDLVKRTQQWSPATQELVTSLLTTIEDRGGGK